MKNITVSDIRKNNLSQIYNLIYHTGKISKQEIASQLGLSLPTVSQKLVKLEDQRLIIKDGHFESSVGRRAVAYTICPEARISIGVGVYNRKLKIVAADLKGNVCASKEQDIEFNNEDSYYKEVAYNIKDFLLDRNYLTDQILGIGFAMSGLVSLDKSKIIYGKTFDNTGLEITAFSRYLKYPCSFFHDAKCAANTELWLNKEINNAFYISLEKYLGGVMISNGEILMGDNGHCGAAEHMQLIPDGRQCYCGNKGCMESYCSINALLSADETVEDFFNAVKEGSAEHQTRWSEYLNYLATAINDLHTLLDRDIILGGNLSHYMNEEDLEKLNELSMAKSHFTNLKSFIHISRSPNDPISVGAALYFIQNFISRI